MTARKPKKKPPKAPAPRRKSGRPRKELDPQLVEDLARIQCTDAEIAAALHVSPALIVARKQSDLEFLNAYEKGREEGKTSLRRLQWKNAKAGNTTMQIWLGKQYLGQRDMHKRGVDRGGVSQPRHEGSGLCAALGGARQAHRRGPTRIAGPSPCTSKCWRR